MLQWLRVCILESDSLHLRPGFVIYQLGGVGSFSGLSYLLHFHLGNGIIDTYLRRLAQRLND